MERPGSPPSFRQQTVDEHTTTGATVEPSSSSSPSMTGYCCPQTHQNHKINLADCVAGSGGGGHITTVTPCHGSVGLVVTGRSWSLLARRRREQ
mmetsp:Transcript_52016/g.125504  ORF Transcript_52016/g.125504 Transcript_52016/m.125504 type:complete len:94 (-) Transcript_52016:41-322(-)